MHGIGNMISYSLESSYRMIELHTKNYNGPKTIAGMIDIAPFKQQMYSDVEPSIEPRLKSFGWEYNNRTASNLIPIKISLLKELKPTTHSIKWGNTISTLLDTPLHESSTFR